MQLQEHHKKFVVKGFAQFMDLSEIVEEFILTFPDDIKAICGMPYNDEAKYLDAYVKRLREEEANDEHEWILDYDEHLNDGAKLFSKEKEGKNERILDMLSNRFRRLNISHTRFPNKYRKFFQDERRAYLQDLQTNCLDCPYNSIEELEALYQIAKKQIVEENDMTRIPLAHQILKSIITTKRLLQEKETVEAKFTEKEALSDHKKEIPE
ncbi:hypothetical protein C6497_05590 [Candidatus Poribacteria bacterium]|nr:MAG: hypothetical protein C6497_05590 [Candidatus Poribacteria bacterium]